MINIIIPVCATVGDCAWDNAEKLLHVMYTVCIRKLPILTLFYRMHIYDLRCLYRGTFMIIKETVAGTFKYIYIIYVLLENCPKLV